MARVKVKAKILPEPSAQRFFSSGCQLLDCVLGGGWALGKVANLVGDKSTGKTLLAIEACANFVRAFPTGRIKYIEAESAFDPAYAHTIGLPDSNLDLVQDIRTIEGVWKAIEDACGSGDSEQLVVVDSLDALSDEAEMERDIGEATYGMAKAKALSEGFRKNVATMAGANMTLMVISQIRDRISIGHGKTVKRSGGHALDFYCSQVLWLYEQGKIKKTINKIERPIGVEVLAKCEKNKVGWPWRECTMPIMYGYGIDDVLAAFNWVKAAAPEHISDLDPRMNLENFKRHLKDVKRSKVAEWVRPLWEEVDAQFRPQSRKYE